MNSVLINLPMLIQFVLRSTVKSTMPLPWYTGDAVDSPPDHNDVFNRLPHTNDVNPQGLKKYSSMES